MSVKIKDNKITMTRGDTLLARVIMKMDDTKEEYVPTEQDFIRFAIKHSKMNRKRTEFVDEEPLFIKQIPSSTLILEIEPEDTAGLEFGDKYVYDIEITYEDGRVDTFIPDAPFELTPEVH